MAAWDFSGDEFVCLGLSGVAALTGTLWWYRPLVGGRMARSQWIRRSMMAVPVVCLAGIGFVLERWSDPVQVAGQTDYMILFMVVGCAWVYGTAACVTVLGVSAHLDAVDRCNPAAAALVCGSVLGAAAVYAGSNVGAGPTIWTTLVPAGLGWAILAGAVLTLSVTAPVADMVAIDRDLSAGVRNGGLMLALGLVVGRAAAGDWADWSQTAGDLLGLSWPVVGLVAAGVWMNWRWRPTAKVPVRHTTREGVLPAVAMVAIAVGYLLFLGPASIGRHVVTYEQYMGVR
jgi:hypothetical protein